VSLLASAPGCIDRENDLETPEEGIVGSGLTTDVGRHAGNHDLTHSPDAEQGRKGRLKESTIAEFGKYRIRRPRPHGLVNLRVKVPISKKTIRVADALRNPERVAMSVRFEADVARKEDRQPVTAECLQ